jgi:hypothetical protein
VFETNPLGVILWKLTHPGEATHICWQSYRRFMGDAPPTDVPTASSVEDGVRGSVIRSIREKFPSANDVQFASVRESGDTWAVEGSWVQPAESPWGVTRKGRFEGSVKVGPGSASNRTAFQLSVQLTLPAVEIGLGLGGPFVTEARTRSPNDQRSDALNPTSPEHRAAANNRSNQMNPNNPAYHRSRGKR